MNPPGTTSTGRGPAVLAFGGNALLPDPFHPEGSEQRARDLARSVLLFLDRSRGVVLVHGNGPQVGMILLRVEATRDRLPPEPLDVLVAETQGSIGVLLERALHNAVLDERPAGRVVYMPTFRGAEVLDAAAAAVWQDLGYRVHAVDCTDAYVHFGSLRCLVNVLRRGP